MTQVINFDSDKTTLSATAWSDPTHHSVLPSSTATPNQSISNFEAYQAENSKLFNFSTSVGSANPAVPLSPDIDLNSTFSILSSGEGLEIAGAITGDNFPSTEAFISDPSGQSVFLGAGFYNGNPYTSLPGDNKRPVAAMSVFITTDDSGNFSSVTHYGNNYTIDEWNNRFTSKDPHNGN